MPRFLFSPLRLLAGRTTPGWWAGLLALALLPGGCTYRPAYPTAQEHQVFFNDFEHLVGWIQENNASLSTERAHSGRYAVRVDKDHPYSILYRLRLSQKFTARPRRMRLSAWTWVENSQEDAQLIFSLSAPNEPQEKSKLYRQIYLADDWPYQRWTHVSRDFDLPAELSSQATLVVYLWAGGAAHPVYADDWELTELH